jgi:phage gpG-like protein
MSRLGVRVKAFIMRDIVGMVQGEVKRKTDAIMEAVGNETVRQIFARTKKGYGSSGGRKVKLAALSESYKKFRKKKPPSGSFATPPKSNLTYTGQMLDAVKYEKNGDQYAVIVDDNTRQDGKRTNAEVARAVSNLNTRTGAPARPFMGLDATQKKIVLREYQKQIRMLVKRVQSKTRR